MKYKVPEFELNSRMERFRAMMNLCHPNWSFAVIFSKVNLYYFTGTMPEGMLVITKDEGETLWARRSYERSMEESFFASIKLMESYRDVSACYKHLPESVYLETEVVPLAMYQRFLKYFPFKDCQSLDAQVAMTRAVKSAYELSFMEQSGKIHQQVLEKRVPQLLLEGISEVDFAAELYKAMLEEGHQGIARFAMFDTEIAIGHIAFGESSIYPTSFNGPGGNYGMSPAVPLLGSRSRKLRRGDLVFVDIGMGVNGYHTDKTTTYVFGATLPAEVVAEHNQCVDIQHKMAAMLRPGMIPSVIYETIMNELPTGFLVNFMGFGNRQVKFLGHGIGLTIDEWPVIAKGFDEPLQENMVFALEPKKGIKGLGMVGIENTFVVTPQGGRCITGDHPGLIEVNP